VATDGVCERAPIMSFQRIFQLLAACGAAVETQHVERRHHPQKKFVPYSARRNRIK
jgi:hypothetical protein